MQIHETLLNEKSGSLIDRYRKIRNGINYYGDDISETTVKEALNEIPAIISELRTLII